MIFKTKTKKHKFCVYDTPVSARISPVVQKHIFFLNKQGLSLNDVTPKNCVNCDKSEFATKQSKISTGWRMGEE